MKLVGCHVLNERRDNLGVESLGDQYGATDKESLQRKNVGAPSG